METDISQLKYEPSHVLSTPSSDFSLETSPVSNGFISYMYKSLSLR